MKLSLPRFFTDQGGNLPTAGEKSRGVIAIKRAASTEDEVHIGLVDSSNASVWRRVLTKVYGDTLYSDVGHDHDSDYAAIGHNHDSTYAPASHTHAISDTTGLQTALNSKLGVGPSFLDLFPLDDEIAGGGPFNFRLTPSTSGTVIASATTGTDLYDTGERHSADAFTWAYIWLDNVGWGWITTTAIA